MYGPLPNSQNPAFGYHSVWPAPGVGTLPVPMHRAIVYVDVEGFASPERTNADQSAVRGGLYHALEEAFTASGVPWHECYHEDRGDGALILVPPEVPKHILVTDVPSALAVALSEHNRTHHRQAHIRLRMAIHAGEVLSDQYGVAGVAINLTARLLEAKPLKRALRRSSGVVALIASAWFFEEVIRHHPAGFPGAYRRARVSVKQTKAIAWIRRPDVPMPQPTCRVMTHTDDLHTRATPATAYVSDFAGGAHAPHQGWQR